jgi:preprotein translocase subunit SecG
MVGVALGRLWDTHPKLAFVCHLGLTLFLGGAAVVFLLSGGDWWAVVILTVAFLVMAAILVFFTRLAIQDQWQPDDDSDGTEGRGRLVNPRAAWGNAQAQERALWVLFAACFLVGLLLLSSNKGAAATLIILSLPLAAMAMRAAR